MKRWSSPVAGLALVAASGGALLFGGTAAASAAPTSYVGPVSVVVDGTTVGCVSAGTYLSGVTQDAAAATQFTIQAGTDQNLQIVDSADVLGLNGSFTSPDVYSYGFLSQMAPVTASGGSQTAAWTFDPATMALTPVWTYSSGSSAPLTVYDDINGNYLGITTDLARFQSIYSGEDPVQADLVVGGSCGGTLTQTVAFTSQPAATTYPGQSYTATATGGGSGNPVTFSSATPATCSVDPTSGATDFLAPGTCTIDADQAAATGYDAAATATQDVTVSAIPSQVTLATAPASPVVGQASTTTATVTVGYGPVAAAGGTVQFGVDGSPLGDPVPVAADGTASTDEVPTTVGDHDVTATYTPADSTDYTGSEVSETVTVAQAQTATTVAVRPRSLVASVAPVAPGAGTPGGTVAFSVDGTTVGTATLTSDGTATLTYTASTSSRHAVAAVYSGDSSFAASSGSTARSNPKLTAHVKGVRSHGWYRGAVRVTFTCKTGSSALVGRCPATVVLTHQPGGTVTRTVKTADGGAATASVTVKIDKSAPRVRLTGVRAANYFAAGPRARCVASDKLSGLASCRVTRVRHGARVVATATAVDKAGNRATARHAYTVLNYAISGATLRHGVWQVHRGAVYTILALGTRPRYVDASIAPTRPRRIDAAFARAGSVAGHRRWAIGVTMSMAVSVSRNWELGIEQGGHVHVLRVHVNG